MRFNFILSRMAIMKKTENKKRVQECGEDRTVIHCLFKKSKMIQPLWKKFLHSSKYLTQSHRLTRQVHSEVYT